jgi:aspartate aminotransferase
MAAAVVAVRDVPESEFVKNNGVLRQRRDRLVELLSSVKGVVCPKTQGAFYLFVDITALIGTFNRSKCSYCNYCLKISNIKKLM